MVGGDAMNHGDIGGLRVVWRDVAGPMRAGLVFRVGVVDETLLNHGISHLVEHLVLRMTSTRTVAYNGQVDSLNTTFFVSGDDSDVVAFLNAVLSSLSALATGDAAAEELERERQVLITEAGRRGGDPLSALLAYRWGARGPGLFAYEELGLYGSAADDLAAWARRFFTRDNAVLWITRPPPPDLEVRLRDGEPAAPPTVDPLAQDTPAWFSLPASTVGAGMLVERSHAAAALAGVLEARLRQHIRHDLGLSYEVATSYIPYSSDQAHIAVFADALPENAPRVREALQESLVEISGAADVSDELDMYKRFARQAWADPASAPGTLDYAARRVLAGTDDADRYVEELDAVSAAEVNDALRRAMHSVMYVVAPDDEVPSAARVADFSPAVVSGKAYRVARKRAAQMNPGARRQRLVVGEEGVSLQYTRNRRIDLRFRDIEAAARWDDGSLVLFGSDGFRIAVLPSDWQGGSRAVRKVEEKIPDKIVAVTGEGPRSPLVNNVENPRIHLIWAAVAAFFALGSLANVVSPDSGSETPVALSAVLMVFFAAVSIALGRKYIEVRNRDRDAARPRGSSSD